MRIIFFGTPEYSVVSLEGLIKKHEILAVITAPDKKGGRGHKIILPPVKTFAQKYNIEVIQEEKWDKIYKKLKDKNADIIITVAFGRIIPKEILELCPYGAINAHASLLPKYRGAAPCARAIMNGESTTGVSIIKMTEKMDAGPIILQKEINLSEDITRGELLNISAKISRDLLLELLDIPYKKWKFLPQDEQRATYAPKITSADAYLDLKEDSVKVYNRYRATTPTPGAWGIFSKKDKQIKIIFTKISLRKDLTPDPSLKKGCVLDIKEGIIINAFPYPVSINTLKPEGKREMGAKDFVNGYGLKCGDIFLTSSS